MSRGGSLRNQENRSHKVLFVLGAPNDAHGRLSGIARGRCNRGLRLWRENPDWELVLTGGFGEHFNTTAHPHAEYLRRELVAAGVPEHRIVALVESRNTFEDARLSRTVLVEHRVRFAVVVTSDFHVERARFLFQREFADLGTEFFFVGVETGDSMGKVDLRALRAHEKAAMARLRAGTAAPCTDRALPKP